MTPENTKRSPKSDTADIGVNETLRFVRRYLKGRRKILEIGGGCGGLALRLMRDGHDVTLIDTAQNSVAAARRLGVNARRSDIRSFRGGPYDAVLFTRSLHHAQPIAQALARAKAALRPNGLLLAEDFSVERMDASTARWLYRLRRMSCRDPLAQWTKEHSHDPPLALGEEMLAALRTVFSIQRYWRVPYLYRYRLQECGDAVRALQREKSLIARGRLRKIGLRVLAQRG